MHADETAALFSDTEFILQRSWPKTVPHCCFVLQPQEAAFVPLIYRTRKQISILLKKIK